MYLLEREQVIPRPRGEVFDYFSDAGNLAELTPDFARDTLPEMRRWAEKKRRRKQR